MSSDYGWHQAGANQLNQHAKMKLVDSPMAVVLAHQGCVADRNVAVDLHLEPTITLEDPSLNRAPKPNTMLAHPPIRDINRTLHCLLGNATMENGYNYNRSDIANIHSCNRVC